MFHEGLAERLALFYLKTMKKGAIIKLLTDCKEALDVYFNAGGDPQGRSDADAVYDIFKTHVDFFTVYT